MELIAYINAQYCYVNFHFFYFLSDLSHINNDRKHAISTMFIFVFFCLMFRFIDLAYEIIVRIELTICLLYGAKSCVDYGSSRT